jgi:alkanesulfonate monooxygenase SsuD/methylene tetrahydromethanopterin reductase-like flavin-dependent oxidoreductase (luciferase family)
LATRRLRIGSGICLIIERDPIITAKEVASIDALSGGRVELGVGAGWNREEMSHHGTDPRVRMAVMAERVGAMKAIWTEDEATYQGGLRVVRADLVVHQALAETSPADIGGRVRADSSRPCARFWGRVVPQLWASRPAGQGRPAQSPG